MRPDILLTIRSNPNLSMYLKYHSEWYKALLRNPLSLSNMDSFMKKEYKLTLEDKLSNANEKLNMVRTFLGILN